MTQTGNSFHAFYVAAYALVATIYLVYTASLLVRSRRLVQRLRALRSQADQPAG